jgi:hypothetical protein
LIKRALRRQVLDILAQASCRTLAIVITAIYSGHSQAMMSIFLEVECSERVKNNSVSGLSGDSRPIVGFGALECMDVLGRCTFT